MREFFDAANERRWSDAARYLVIPAGEQARRDELTRHLKSVLDIRRPIDLETLSGESGGRLDDRLPGSLEQVGTIGTRGHAQPVRLVRSSDAQGDFWAFSATTVSHVDDWYADRIDHETFSTRQRAIWERIEATPSEVRDAVLESIRKRLP